MSIVLSGIRIGIDDVEQEALEEARRLLRVGKNQILQIVPVKKSLDARRRDHISVVYSVRVDLADEEQKYAKAAAVRLGQNRVKYLDNQPVSFEKGKEKILKKVGEECTEVVIGAMKGSKEETIYEISDLCYHVLVLMVESGITIEEIKAELASRHVIDHKVKQETMQ